MENGYLSPSKIAEMTGLKKATIYTWIRTGQLKAYRPCGKNYLIKREDFEAFMESNKVNV